MNIQLRIMKTFKNKHNQYTINVRNMKIYETPYDNQQHYENNFQIKEDRNSVKK